VAAFAGLYYVYVDDGFNAADKKCWTSPMGEQFIGVTLGYMFYDTIVSIKAYGLFGFNDILLHHINISMAFFGALVRSCISILVLLCNSSILTRFFTHVTL